MNTLNQDSINALKDFAVEQLSCKELRLKREEFTIRCIESINTSFMMAPLECDIHVHHFPERIEKQDKICMEVRNFLLKTVSGIQDVKVRLQLSELGHSMPI
ncbi:hypothetical protein FACS189428_4410 [Clostridia bacterium]|nr:hypothetical protein FACS189428_4410 [Clostridia bacterium]